MKRLFTVLLSLILGIAMLTFAACADTSPNAPSDGNGQTGGNNENGNNENGNNGNDESGDDESGGTTEPQSPATSGDPASDTLVVYFSWSGNTQEMADYIAGQTGAYLVEILPEEPYEGSYNDVAYGRAQEEAEQNARPAVSQATYDLIDMEKYDTVIVGYPIWWHTAPMVIGTFLEHYDWTGKDIYPFSQSASMSTSQFDESMQFVRDCAKNANVHDGLFVRPNDSDAIDEYLSANGLVGEPQTPSETSDVLVVYFSASSSQNTARVANYIAQATGGSLFELVPVDAYTSEDLNYNNDSSRVVQEYENPALRDTELVTTTVENWVEYDVVFIGYPIWWGIAAWPVNGFVENNDFTGKTVIPFCTSASSPPGQSGALLEELAGTGNWQEGHRFRSGATENDVISWVGSLNIL